VVPVIGTNLIAEYDAAGTTLQRRYVHGPGTDEPIARRPDSTLGYRPPASRLAGNNLLQLNSYRTAPRRTRFTIASRMTAPISEATSPMMLKSF
jgi:hypothetical protein